MNAPIQLRWTFPSLETTIVCGVCPKPSLRLSFSSKLNEKDPVTGSFSFSLDEKESRRLGLGHTPQTIVVSKEGKVHRNWIGAFIQSRSDVEQFFGVRLPGLPQATIRSSDNFVQRTASKQ